MGRIGCNELSVKNYQRSPNNKAIKQSIRRQFLFNFAQKERRFASPLANFSGTRWRSWLRQCTTNCKVAVSIPDGVFGILL
jgi:hypothetical protein